MQIKDEGDYKDRSLYYLSKLYSGQLKSGEVYGSLNQCISINIINFNLFDCEKYHSSFSMREDSSCLLYTSSPFSRGGKFSARQRDGGDFRGTVRFWEGWCGWGAIPPVVARIFSGDSTSPLTREARVLAQGECGSADAKQAETGFCLAYMLSSA